MVVIFWKGRLKMSNECKVIISNDFKKNVDVDVKPLNVRI